MSKILCIHGIANTFRSAAQLTTEWAEALQGGLDEAGGPVLAQGDLDVVAYGALFRLTHSGKGTPGQPMHAGTTEDEEAVAWEAEFIDRMWGAAAALSAQSRRAGDGDAGGEDPGIQPPGFEGKARTPLLVQRALAQLSKSRFVKAIGPSLLVSELRQVRLFLHDPSCRERILQRMAEKVRPDTRVIIAHSLGSVVAYEALCAHLEWEIDTLVTLGSPLGIPNLVFDALARRARGETDLWPGVRQWVNIADQGDLVALIKELAPLFGPVKDVLVHNGWKAHDVTRYLGARETGEAVAQGLAQAVSG